MGRQPRSVLLEFYGIECDHCVDMEPVIEQLKEETGITMRRFEVWYNDDNLKLLQKLDKDGACGGVPFFYNKMTRDWICGATTYANFKSWAEGRPSERFLPPPKEEEDEEGVAKKDTSRLGKLKSFVERLRTEGTERMNSRMGGVKDPSGSANGSGSGDSGAAESSSSADKEAAPVAAGASAFISALRSLTAPRRAPAFAAAHVISRVPATRTKPSAPTAASCHQSRFRANRAASTSAAVAPMHFSFAPL